MLNPKHIIQQHRRGDVEHDIRPSDPEIAPAVSVADIDRGQKLVGGGKGAVPTIGGCTGVLELTDCAGAEVVGEILGAGLA